jgi:methyl-accepting chemotaxis protein
MKMRTHIVGLGLLGAVLAGVAGGIGLWSSHRMGQAIEAAILAGEALQTIQHGDMMHDAIRGDSQLALIGVLEKSPERITEAERGLKDHAEEITQALAHMRALPIGAEARAALDAADPIVAQYVQSAQAMVAGARVDLDTAHRSAATVQSRFAELEPRLAALSELLGRDAAAFGAAARAGVVQTGWAIGGALLVTSVALLVGALALAGWLMRPITAAVGVADRLASGDLTGRIDPHGIDETVQLLQAMARMQDRLVHIVGDVKSNADQVAGASAQIALGNQDLSGRTEQQASALQQTAATMEQLGSTVRANADNAQAADRLAVSASAVATQGGTLMGQVVDTMSGINQSSRRIADIIAVIDGIAFQTNILALNAAVEAARAGEQGRGFAVVASEVRSLAQRSAEAAREVKSLVNASVERVEAGTALVGQAGQTMQDIVASIGRVNQIVSEISAASREQSHGVGQVGAAVSQMDQSTQQSAALVEQTAAAAESLNRQAQLLVQSVALFKV